VSLRIGVLKAFSRKKAVTDNLARQFLPSTDTKYGTYAIPSVMHYPFNDCLYEDNLINGYIDVGTKKLDPADRSSINALYGCLEISLVVTAGKYTTVQGTDVTPIKFFYHPDWQAQNLHYVYMKKGNVLMSTVADTKIYTCDIAPSGSKFKLTNCANAPTVKVNAAKGYIIEDVL